MDESLWSRARVFLRELVPSVSAVGGVGGVEAGAVDPRTCEDHVEQLSLRLKQGGHSEVLCPLPFYAVVVRL